MKKIKDKIAAKKYRFLRKDENPFFRKDEKGQDLFYPWGCPGEAFRVSNKQKKKLSFFLYLLVFIFGISVLAGIFFDIQGIISSQTRDYIVTITAMILTILYWYGVWLFGKNAALYIVPKDKRPDKPDLGPWVILYFPISLIFTAVYSPVSIITVSVIFLSGVYIFFISRFLIKIRCTRGYYFANEDE